MSEPKEQRRRYSDKEVGLILKRAAELQRQGPDSAAEGSGLTLSELEGIATEAGIDPGYLRRAASEVDVHGRPEGWEWLAGGPVTIRFERTLPGELPQSGFDRLVPEIQKAAAGHGQASMVGRTLSFRSGTSQSGRSLQVTVSARDGQTYVLIEERMHGIAGGLFGGIMGGGGLGLGLGLGIGLGELGSIAFAVLWPTAVIGGAYWIARTIFGTISRRRRRMLRELLDRITEHVRTATADKAIESKEQAPQLPRA